MDERLIDQASDVLSFIFFHNFLQNSLQRSFKIILLFLDPHTELDNLISTELDNCLISTELDSEISTQLDNCQISTQLDKINFT